MRVNADFSRPAVVHAARADWVASPMPGVDRKMLDRVGGEVARATSLVRYAPGSAFSAHTHGGGEEFLVLDGIFQDERGDYPAGTYVRNPPTSRHTPGSAEGCTILVKLWQFDPADRQQVVLDAEGIAFHQPEDRPGVAAAVLHADSREEVRVELWAPGARIDMPAPGGLELLVLDGGFAWRDEDFIRQSWLRLPVGRRFEAVAAPEGARVWLKEGHLRFAGAEAPA